MSDIPERLAAALSDRYVLERPIGTGGMATVYLARDLRHKRLVALKVVRPELGGRLGVERFLREIELAARLQHPNILPVFDSGVIDDGDGGPVPYFVMPYVEGQTLRQQLQREGRFPVDAALTLAGEVADALAYAHSKGVVHRDIKPENILLSGGHAVVADFGVAKALEQGTAASPSAGATQLTRAGMAMGTPAYMSPEQATGDDVVDARSDQYSLACVLYEMLAGKPPFEGPSAQTIIAKSLTAPRPHVGSIRAGVSSELDQVVAKALSLEPGDRYPDMGSLRSALAAARGLPGRGARRWIVGGGAIAVLAGIAMGVWYADRPSSRRVAPAVEMLAVLPFHTSGPGVEFLSEGMMDLLATNLRGVAGINTVDPRAVLREWGSTRGGDDLKRALTVGRDLDAGSVVLGSAVSTGGKVRVAADLYGVDGKRLGRAQVDGPADSVLAVVDRLSLALLRDVWRSKQPLPSLRLASLTTDSIDALRSYLEGERYYRRTQWDSALSAYTRAVETDSTFALAHLRRAQAIGWIGGYGNQDAHQAVAAGVRFAKRLPPRDRRLLAAYRAVRSREASLDRFAACVRDRVPGGRRRMVPAGRGDVPHQELPSQRAGLHCRGVRHRAPAGLDPVSRADPPHGARDHLSRQRAVRALLPGVRWNGAAQSGERPAHDGQPALGPAADKQGDRHHVEGAGVLADSGGKLRLLLGPGDVRLYRLSVPPGHPVGAPGARVSGRSAGGTSEHACRPGPLAGGQGAAGFTLATRTGGRAGRAGLGDGPGTRAGIPRRHGFGGSGIAGRAGG